MPTTTSAINQHERGDRRQRSGRRDPPRSTPSRGSVRRAAGVDGSRPAEVASSRSRSAWASVLGQIGQSGARAAAGRHRHPDRREPEDPGPQRLVDVDGLDPVQAQMTLGPTDQAGLHVQLAAVGPEPADEPGRYRQRDREQDHEQQDDDDQQHGAERAGGQVQRAAVPEQLGHPAIPLQPLAPEDHGDHRHGLPGLEHRRERVQPAGREHRAPGCGGADPGRHRPCRHRRVCHSPAAPAGTAASVTAPPPRSPRAR